MKLRAMIVGALLLTATTFGQTTEETARSKSSSEFQSDKTVNTFVFWLPEHINQDMVDAAQEDYSEYFSVDFKEGRHELKVELKTGDATEKFYVHRMLAAMRVLYVEQDEVVHSIRDFSLNHIEN